MEEKLTNGTKVQDKITKEVLTIDHAIETNNQFGYGVYLYRFKEHLDTGFGLYRREFVTDFTE